MLLTEQDIYLFREGPFVRAYEKLGAHSTSQGTHFAVWAPNAQSVAVVGDFNGWNPTSHKLEPRGDSSGLWEAFLPYVRPGTLYKYHIVSRHACYSVDKADPYAFYAEVPPRTASVVWDLSYEWGDDEWMRTRARVNALDAPISIYEVHLGSWRRVPEEHNRSLTYRELAHALADYCTDMGYTHVELVPIMEHPFYGSWGYQVTGYFAPTSRYGTPQDFMYFVDYLHRRGIGVIMDWVPSHFPSDQHGLAYFDGTHLYEHADPRQGFHPEWNSSIFNYGRSEVRNFLASSALFWLDMYHNVGLWVDAVASMLYLDYARKQGEWIPNQHGGREILDAVEFLKQLNLANKHDYTGTQTIAEESTAWPMVSRFSYLGGLGFGEKWNMGWMHDTLKYFQTEPLFRKYAHNSLTFSIWYAFNENFVLPISHDEVEHGKGSLLGKMSGDEWQKFANLRLFLGYMWTHPGKKLLFMGSEFGQVREWAHDYRLVWHVLQFANHAGVQHWMRDLNHFYKETPSLWELDFSGDGFQWIDANNGDLSVLLYLRKGKKAGDVTLVALNFTPVPRDNYQVGVTRGGRWLERLNSDAKDYWGSGIGDFGLVEASRLPSHGHFHSLFLSLPPLAVVFLTPE